MMWVWAGAAVLAVVGSAALASTWMRDPRTRNGDRRGRNR